MSRSNIQRAGKPVAGAEPGNKRAVTHGAQSPALVEPRARELSDEVFESNPQLRRGQHEPAVLRYATTLARIEHVYRWLDTQPDPVFRDARKGQAHPVFERLERWESAASRDEDRLAITPLVRMRLRLGRGDEPLDVASQIARLPRGDDA